MRAHTPPNVQIGYKMNYDFESDIVRYDLALHWIADALVSVFTSRHLFPVMKSNTLAPVEDGATCFHGYHVILYHLIVCMSLIN